MVLIARTASRLEGGEGIKGDTDSRRRHRSGQRGGATSKIASAFDGAGHLVNNAGIFSVALAETFRNVSQTINTNLVAPFLFVRAFLNEMTVVSQGT